MYMIRTQLYLPKALYQEIDLVAKREKKPKAEIIRDALEEGLQKKKAKTNAGDALLRLAALGKKLNVKNDDPHLSTNIDKYLYEEWNQK